MRFCEIEIERMKININIKSCKVENLFLKKVKIGSINK